MIASGGNVAGDAALSSFPTGRRDKISAAPNIAIVNT
jgi:hypothetical protein